MQLIYLFIVNIIMDMICVSRHREHPDGGRVGLNKGNLLLRSCTIRNTENVMGIVVYAGKCPGSFPNLIICLTLGNLLYS